MLYEVTLRGPRGERETVTVDAAGGDDAAAKAFQPYRIVTSVQPAPAKVDGRAALFAEYEAVVGKKPFKGWSEEILREKIAAGKAD